MEVRQSQLLEWARGRAGLTAVDEKGEGCLGGRANNTAQQIVELVEDGEVLLKLARQLWSSGDEDEDASRENVDSGQQRKRNKQETTTSKWGQDLKKCMTTRKNWSTLKQLLAEHGIPANVINAEAIQGHGAAAAASALSLGRGLPRSCQAAQSATGRSTLRFQSAFAALAVLFFLHALREEGDVAVDFVHPLPAHVKRFLASPAAPASIHQL